MSTKRSDIVSRCRETVEYLLCMCHKVFNLQRNYFFYNKEHVAVDTSACLDAHNRARASHKSGQLEWDAGLAEHAQKWADHLANDVGHMVHAQNTGEGENLFWSKGSRVANCEEAVKAWYVNP